MPIRQIIIINIVLLNIWLRISNNVLQIFRYRKKIIVQTIIYSATGVTALAVYPFLTKQVHTPDLVLTQEVNTTSIIVFITYITSLARTIRKTKSDRKHRGNISIGYFLLIVSIWVTIGKNTNWQWASMFFFIAAFAEELIKRCISYKNYNHYYIATQDIIVFGLLTALWFSFRENILIGLNTTNNALTRTPMYIIHALLTCIIASSIVKKLKYQKRLLGVCITLAIVIHTTYNITHEKISTIGFVAIGLGLYLLLSYFFYKNDSQYITT